MATLCSAGRAGAELVLELQKQSLDPLDLTPQERARRRRWQKQINAAVQSPKKAWQIYRLISGPRPIRLVLNVLNFNPAKVLEIRQPLLIVHRAMDHEVPVEHADRLATIAKKESDS